MQLTSCTEITVTPQQTDQPPPSLPPCKSLPWSMGCTCKHVIGGEAFQTVGFFPFALKEGARRATWRAEKLVIRPPERGWKQKRKKGRANIDSNRSIIYLFNIIHHLDFSKGYFHWLKWNSVHICIWQIHFWHFYFSWQFWLYKYHHDNYASKYCINLYSSRKKYQAQNVADTNKNVLCHFTTAAKSLVDVFFSFS